VLQLIVSPDSEDGSLKINQDAYLYKMQLLSEQSYSYTVKPKRVIYLHCISGVFNTNDIILNEGGGAEISDVSRLDFNCANNAEVLVFDLPV